MKVFLIMITVILLIVAGDIGLASPMCGADYRMPVYLFYKKEEVGLVGEKLIELLENKVDNSKYVRLIQGNDTGFLKASFLIGPDYYLAAHYTLNWDWVVDKFSEDYPHNLGHYLGFCRIFLVDECVENILTKTEKQARIVIEKLAENENLSDDERKCLKTLLDPF